MKARWRRFYWRLRLRLARWGLGLPGKIMYIGGSDVLPAPLSRQEEGEYIAALAQGDEGAASVLIEHNLRLVAHIVKKYYINNGNDQEDLISIGTIGLIKAIDSFDPGKGIRLSSYASKCIENEILMFFRSGKNVHKIRKNTRKR